MRPGHPLQLALGLSVWSLWFVAAYGGLSVACALAPPAAEQGAVTWLNALLGALTLITAAWLLRQAWRLWRLPRPETTAGRFVIRAGAGLDLLAALATLFVGLPIAGLPPCV